MHILILGAGALGSLLGARLSTTDAGVTLLGSNREHVQSIKDNGLFIEELDGRLSRYSLSVSSSPGETREKADLIIVLVKSYATRVAISGIDVCRRSDTLFLTLQNGIGNWEAIAGMVGKDFALAGTTAQGSTLLGPGRIRHGGNGPTYIGEINGPASDRVHSIVEVFRSAGLDAHPSDDMERLIWEKLVVNVGINAITALTGVRNGMVAEVEDAREISRAAVLEALAVARAKGVFIDENMADRVLSVAKATAVNRSSMGQDVDRRKRTEIDAINGAIVRFGQEAGLDVPVNHTLTQLVKTLEAAYLANK
jgi:2-dehydropantoate 2-reductase